MGPLCEFKWFPFGALFVNSSGSHCLTTCDLDGFLLPGFPMVSQCLDRRVASSTFPGGWSVSCVVPPIVALWVSWRSRWALSAPEGHRSWCLLACSFGYALLRHGFRRCECVCVCVCAAAVAAAAAAAAVVCLIPWLGAGAGNWPSLPFLQIPAVGVT